MNFLSPAKVNLGLRIVGRKEDGYHLLESLFWPIDLCDEISIEKNPLNKISMEWTSDAPVVSTLPKPESNSIYKLLSLNPQLGTWSVHVKKRIPIGGGLGGSSSNAGTVIKYFRDQKLLSPEDATRIALSVGADVPFFMDPSPTWIEGIGEERTALDFELGVPELTFHLIAFEQPCITKDIFQRYRASEAPFSTRTVVPTQWNSESLNTYLSRTSNDLEGAATAAVPNISKALDLLRGSHFLYVGLSGSGSTCFAVSKSGDALESISKDLQHFCRNYRCSYIEASTFSAARRSTWKSPRLKSLQ